MLEQNSSQTTKWYQNPIIVILLIIFFFPLGLYLMWKNKIWTKKVRIIVTTIIALIFLVSISQQKNQSVATNFKLINRNDIPYLKDPWNDFVGFKEGDVIGIVLMVGRSGSTEIVFNYYSENCWGNTNREGTLEFASPTNSAIRFSDPLTTDKKYFGKNCLIVGKVKKIVIIKPKDACDETHGTVILEEPYIEVYNPQKTKTNTNTTSATASKYFIGPPIKSAQTLFGKYKYVSLGLDGSETVEDHSYILLANISSFEKDVQGISQKHIRISKEGNWDGYAAYAENYQIIGIGFWRVDHYSPIKQNHNYPAVSAGEMLNGADIYLKWMPSSMGLSIRDDGIYQIYDSPYGLDWMDEYSKEDYRTFMKSPSGNVKWQKVKN